MPALLHGTVCQIMFQSESRTKHFKKLTCLYRNFNSFIYFIFWSNMIYPPVYFVGGDDDDDDDEIG